MSRPSEVIGELRRRHALGQSLQSGANRGDWLYAAAVYAFGSWGKAIEAAGFNYAAIKQRPLTRAEVVAALRELVGAGKPVRAADHLRLRYAAARYFDTWREAIVQAGGEAESATKWTRAVVLDAIRRDLQAALPVTSNAVRRRDENLYAAGRRRFGSWDAAVSAATVARARRS
jgi:hypothetical protein